MCSWKCASARAAGINQGTRPYFEVGDSELPYAEKLERYRELADAYFQLDEYEAFCAEALPHLDELVVEHFAGGEFDGLLVDTVRSTFPPHEHDEMVGRYRGLVGAWVADQTAS